MLLLHHAHGPCARLLLAAAAGLLALVCPASGAGAVLVAEDDLLQAEAALRRAIQEGDAALRREALAHLVSLGDPDAIDFLLNEHTRCGEAWRKAREQVVRREYELQHKQKMIATLELRLRRDESLQASIDRQKQALQKLREELGKSEERVAKEGPWLSELQDATGRLFRDLPRHSKKLHKGLWESAEKAEDLAKRLAAVELLGHVGAKGTAVDMQKMLFDITLERSRLERELPREMADVKKLERRMQEEAARTGGRLGRGTMLDYERVRKRAAQIRRDLTITGYLLDACVDAGAAALRREASEDQVRSIDKLIRGLKKAKHGSRLLALRMLSRTGSKEALSALMPLLERERDPAAISELVREVGALGRTEITPLLLESYLQHESWYVRSATASSLARLRARDAIPALIEGMYDVDGRLRTDYRRALTSLTGMDFRTNAELWSRWWRDAESGFVVPAAPAESVTEDDIAAEVGVTFFGIETDSQKVLFVLDLSGSMNFSMVPRDNPTDERGREFDMPQGDEISRLTAAKRALIKALGGLRDGAEFGLVMYASDVFALRDDMIEMDTKARAEVLEYVDELSATGGTNIYGALDHAFWMIGLEGGDEWAEPLVDTIYFLSDGRASVGATTDPDEILSFVEERNRNAGVVIHTIGVSGAQDAYFLRSLAEQNGGTYASQ